MIKIRQQISNAHYHYYSLVLVLYNLIVFILFKKRDTLFSKQKYLQIIGHNLQQIEFLKVLKLEKKKKKVKLFQWMSGWLVL